MTADTPHLDVILSQAPIISVGHDGRSADLGKAEAELSALKATASRAEALERVRIAAANVAAMYQTDPLTTVDGLTDTDFIMRISALRAALAAQGGDRGAV